MRVVGHVCVLIAGLRRLQDQHERLTAAFDAAGMKVRMLLRTYMLSASCYHAQVRVTQNSRIMRWAAGMGDVQSQQQELRRRATGPARYCQAARPCRFFLELGCL